MIVLHVVQALPGSGQLQHYSCSIWIDFQMSVRCEDTWDVSHVNAHPKLTSAEKRLSNQVDRMTHSVDNQPLSSVILVIASWAHEQSEHGYRDGG